MFGNLIRECGVLEKLSKTAQNELSNIVTILLGISVGASMRAENFLQIQTVLIMFLGLIAFIGDTACGLLFAKLLNIKYEINGYGNVVKTNINEGELIDLNNLLVIDLEG